MTKRIVLLGIFLLVTISSQAQTTVELKSGHIIEGELLEQNDKYITLKVNGITLTYWLDEIEGIESKGAPLTITEQNQSLDIQEQEMPANTEDIRRIKKVWETVLMAFITNDIDSMMKPISTNYSGTINGEIVNYAELKPKIEKGMNAFFKNHYNCSISDIKILSVNISNDEAKVSFMYNLNAFNTASKQKVSYKRKSENIFSKENEKWKIISMKRSSLP